MIRQIASVGNALTQRTLTEGGWRFWIAPASIVVVAIFFCCAALWSPYLFTSVSRQSLASSSKFFFSDVSDAGTAMFLSALFIQLPYLIGVLSALTSAANARGLFDIDASQGGLELMLSYPLSRVAVFGGVIVAATKLALLGWMAFGLPLILVELIAFYTFREVMPFHFLYIVFVFFLPLGTAIWGSLVTLSLAVSLPRTFGNRMNMLMGLLNIPIALPGILAFTFINVWPEANLGLLAALGVSLTAICCFLIAIFLFSKLSNDTFLNSV